MAAVCKVCRLPDQATLSLALASGDSLRDIAGRVGISKSALGRHKLHAARTPLGAEIVRVVEAHRVEVAETIVEEISRLKADAARLAAKAEAEHDYRGALGAVKLLTDVALRLEELTAGSADTAAPVRVTFAFARSAATGRTVDAAADGMPEDTDAPLRGADE